MYCNSCGQKNPDNATYCSKCGKLLTPPSDGSLDAAKAVTAVQNPVSVDSRPNPSSVEHEFRSSQERSDLVAYIDRVMRDFEPIANQYEIINQTVAEKNHEGVFTDVPGCTGASILVAGIFCVIMGLINIGNPDNASESYIVAGSLGIALGLAIWAMYARYTGKKENQIDERKKSAIKKIEDFYPSVPDNVFNICYCDPWSLEAIKQVIETGHADSIKEALQILEARKRWVSLDSNLKTLLDTASDIRAATGFTAAASIANLIV